MTPGSKTRGQIVIGIQQKSQTPALTHLALRLPNPAPLPGGQGHRGRGLGLGLKPCVHGQPKPSSSRRAPVQAATGALLSSTSNISLYSHAELSLDRSPL